MDFAYPRK